MQGALLGLGAPLGWLVIRALAGYGFIEELTDDPALYVYLLVPTVLSFASFGVVLGIEGDRLLKRVAGALASVARQGETAARVGRGGIRAAPFRSGGRGRLRGGRAGSCCRGCGSVPSLARRSDDDHGVGRLCVDGRHRTSMAACSTPQRMKPCTRPRREAETGASEQKPRVLRTATADD